MSKPSRNSITRRTVLAVPAALAAQVTIATHEKHMRRAIELAANVPNTPLGHCS